MKLVVDGRAVFAPGALKGGRPLILFLHGAGMDHSVWAMQSRWFSARGVDVLALDLPGHGRSDGPALPTIDAMADWTSRLVEAAGADKAILVGHSMGALVALATAARHPARVAALALVGAAAKMPVHPDMLALAKAGEEGAVAMVSLWGLGAGAVQGGAPTPGHWMLGSVWRLIARSAPGVLHNDLAACDAAGDVTALAARVACPTLVLSGERDMMTPARGGKALAASIAGARHAVIPGAGHMMMIERDRETLQALRPLCGA